MLCYIPHSQTNPSALCGAKNIKIPGAIVRGFIFVSKKLRGKIRGKDMYLYPF